jgi:hypothetical protein
VTPPKIEIESSDLNEIFASQNSRKFVCIFSYYYKKKKKERKKGERSHIRTLLLLIEASTF